jgi:hypothetical protein
MQEQVGRLRSRYAFGTAGWLGNLSGRLEAGPWREWNVVSVTRTSDPLRTGTQQQLACVPARLFCQHRISHTTIDSMLESFLTFIHLLRRKYNRSYSGGSLFESGPGHRFIITETSRGFLCPPKLNPG